MTTFSIPANSVICHDGQLYSLVADAAVTLLGDTANCPCKDDYKGILREFAVDKKEDALDPMTIIAIIGALKQGFELFKQGRELLQKFRELRKQK